jgi:hypothetical protein
MANLRLRTLANFRVLPGILISAALAVAASAQAARQLEVEVSPNQQVRILASDVSYGEVLRALQKKLGWEIEIPALADEMKISYIRVETAQPQIALGKLLEGSRLRYAFVAEANKPRSMRVVVIPMPPREASESAAKQDTASTSPISGDTLPSTTSPLPPDQGQSLTVVQPDATAAEALPGPAQPPSTMPLADAINAIGAPPGVPLADVGKMMTLPISDAARIMGVPPGASPGDVGKTITLPLPTGAGRRP